ncbi:MAG: polyprenyl synthetase family protein [Candidatus Blackburnbacteria bacterium]|nr:polyprenyl synthetase family protein [Candidatus Blackburnbacteria bacterium]
MKFIDYLNTNAKTITPVIRSILTDWKALAKKTDQSLLPPVDLYIDRSFGGKTLRGVLVCLGYRIAGGKGSSEILKVAAAIEMFQTSILAHDDIIDLSPTRRGKPTIYKALGDNHYALSQTICLGDIGFFLATQAIADSKFKPEYKVKALSSFSKMVINTCLGEMLDVELPRLKKGKTDKAVLTIHKLKTSYYTIIYPLTIGAILCGADEDLLKEFEIFGEKLGIAFQIQDDILGVFGNEEQLGKSVTSDIEEGKNTLLITEALKGANKNEKLFLKKHYGGQIAVTEEVHKRIKEIFESTGALAYSQKQALSYVRKGKKVIPQITKKKEIQNLLYELADLIVSRDK